MGSSWLRLQGNGPTDINSRGAAILTSENVVSRIDFTRQENEVRLFFCEQVYIGL